MSSGTYKENNLQCTKPDIRFSRRGKATRKFVARASVDPFREILAVETDAEKRKLIEKLLMEAESELAAEEEKDREQKAG